MTPTKLLGRLVGIFVITTIVFIILYGVEKTRKTITTENRTLPLATTTDDVCFTPYCVKAANYLIESIDETVEPCEDFFHFACGTWIKNTRIPDDVSAQSPFNLLRTQLYYNVIDEADIEATGVDPILSLVNTELGGWPILQGSSWSSSTFDLSNLFLKLRKYAYNIIYRIGQSDLALGQKQYYANETNITIAYRQLIRELAMALGNDTSMIDQDVNDIFEFEKNISKYHWTDDEQRARYDETVRTTFNNLSLTFNTTFDFTDYVRRSYLLGNVTLQDTDVVAISEIEYLNNVSLILQRASPRTIQNYMVWRFILSRTSDMPQHIRIIRQRFDRIFRGTNTERPRTARCGSFVNRILGFAVSKLYIKKYFDENAFNESLEMINNIRDAFIEMLQGSTWMDVESKTKAIEKAKSIDQHIGYPDYLASDNNTKLDKDYAEYTFNSSYIRNILKLLEIFAKENFQLLRKPVDKKDWDEYSAPSVVNAFYDPSTNRISFPAGILQIPFFNKDAPKYLNYGGIGYVIGHEVTHGFDDTGRQFDKDGNRIPWWTEETIKKFNERKTCIINQYSNYTVTQIDMQADGNLTQGEDIADNGGLRGAFFAYQKWAANNKNVDKRLPGLQKYSSEQLFFINYAYNWCIKMTNAYAVNRLRIDVHSLDQFRVTGPTSNFDEFDRAFGCTPGQGNSRKDKCSVW
ncbi:unnamed protein product [Rotaria sordida]|uniref:Uncharacterized protein n=2 Tax=Rotaria sordida TaxID=392033 RepID=A0A813ZB56_9BILA|nr:unnamed protein product [Rotaria sordida]